MILALLLWLSSHAQDIDSSCSTEPIDPFYLPSEVALDRLSLSPTVKMILRRVLELPVNNIPSIKELSRSILVKTSTPSTLVSYPDHLALLGALRKLANVLRPAIGRREDVAFKCAAIHRHIASTRALVQDFPGELERRHVLLPIGERLRDLAISGVRCGVESAVTVAAISRSWLQVAELNRNQTRDLFPASHDPSSNPRLRSVSPLFSLIDRYVEGIDTLRLTAMASPLFDMLHNLARFLHVRDSSLIPTVLLAPREAPGQSAIFGFDCGEAGEKFRVLFMDWQNGSVLTDTLLKFPLPKTCEAGQAVQAFLRLSTQPAAEWPELNRKLSGPWILLQSVNANWHYDLVDWGEAISVSLRESHTAAISAGLQPNRWPLYCKTSEVKQYREWLSDEYLVRTSSSAVNDDEWEARAVANSIEFLASIHPDCSVELATAYAAVSDSFIRMLYKDKALLRDVLQRDLSSIVETIWQTIAGEKLLDVIANPMPLFELMARYWRVANEAL